MSALLQEPTVIRVTATITSKGQITIPSQIRARLGLKTGQVLEFDEEAPFLKAHRVVDREKAYAVLGSMKEELKAKSVDEWIEWLRGPVELPPQKKSRAAKRR
ncbi:MAG: AbrB/MazE/SpoVT family DNA-binding domain-containing protein [Chthoniobacterales bacterium]